MNIDKFNSEKMPDDEFEQSLKKFKETPLTFFPRKPKPIALIKVWVNGYKPEDQSEIIKELNYAYGEKMKDYHVFVIPQEDYTEHHDSIEFQVFYEKDQQPIYHEELKKIIEDSLKPPTP